MDAAALGAAAGAPNPAAPVGGDQQPRAERLSAGVQQQLNLEGMRARAVGLYKAISRILEDFDAIARANPNASPKWQDVLGQFSMVSMELFNIVEDIKKVSKVFVVYPRNVNAENAAILPVMLSSKLLPEMEAEEVTKRDNLLSGITNLTVSGQIEKLKTRIDMIGSACETAEKVIAESRKNYGLGARQGANLGPTLDKAQAAKIQEQEGLLRAADCVYRETKGRCVYPKNTSTFVPNVVNTQGNPMQVSGGQLLGRPAPSPGTTGTPNFENVSTPPMPYANSPRSGTNMMNTPSPQQHLTAQQHRQKLMQTSQQQQLHTQQQLRPSAAGMLAQIYRANPNKNYRSLANSRCSTIKPCHNSIRIGRCKLGACNLMANIPGSMQSQSLLPQMQGLNQYSLTGGHPQRSHPSQMLTDQMFGMGGANSTSMMGMQQQQQFNMQANAQNLQQGMTSLQNQTQNPNFPQQRQQNQQ
uniref:Mediator of RNA polymerase II transcription subunit 8 n=1 Tax=Oryza meridionalis TaxID=40149 RepID=A0A0E0D291_9ORYZ